MQVVADPNQLRFTASLFSNGANELRQKAKRLEGIQTGLVQGRNSWQGAGAQGFTTTMEKIQNEIQQKAGILEEAAQILIRFAYQMDNVNQIRNQASSLERTLWGISGDSEAAFHERQSISFQVNQLLQEAEWQANAADAQATSALHSLATPMPDLSLGNGVPKAPANEPWYDRVVDWFKEQGQEFVVAYEKHWTTGNIWYDELNYWTLGIPDQVEKVFHTKPFSLENLEANLELFVSVVPATKAESVALDGVKVASNAAEEKITEQEALDVEEVPSSKTQGTARTETADVARVPSHEVTIETLKGIEATDVTTNSSETVNEWWKTTKGYENPPYKPSTLVTKFTVQKDTRFVRVYDGVNSRQKGGWLMRAEDIEGLTPEQIRDKYALPQVPIYITDVIIPKGSTLEGGIANDLPGWGAGGGIQYDTMGKFIGEFENPRPLK